LLHSNRKLK